MPLEIDVSIAEWEVWVAGLLSVTLVLGNFGLRVAALGIIPGGRRPSTGMAWLLLVLLAPVLGLVAFLLFGSTRLGRDRLARQAEVNGRIAERARQVTSEALPYAGSSAIAGVVDLNHNLGSLPLVDGNDVEFIEDYRTSLKLMAEEVSRAQTYVHVEFYISAWDDWTDPLFSAMRDAAERGVKVRFLFDHLGSRGIPGHKQFLAKLDASKIEFHPMLPIRVTRGRIRRPDLRNHRKLLVVDGRVGFMGSQNLTEPGYNKPKNHELGREWVELMTRVHGPVVATLEAVFASDWFIETQELLPVSAQPAPETNPTTHVRQVSAQLVPSGPGYVAENNLRMFTTLIYSATERISITSPYFVPDESLLYAVTTAAQRGIDIELFVSELSDQFMVGHAQASYYKALLEAGVRIYLYPAPFILHSKHFTIDDEVAVLGSSNMDMRSFSLNYEISLMLLGPEIVARMRSVEDHYRDLSRELSLEEWVQRKPGQKYLDNVMRLTAALQ